MPPYIHETSGQPFANYSGSEGSGNSTFDLPISYQEDNSSKTLSIVSIILLVVISGALLILCVLLTWICILDCIQSYNVQQPTFMNFGNSNINTINTINTINKNGKILTFNPLFNKPTNDNYNCAICLEQNDKNSISTQCGHNFHKKCIEKWMFHNIKENNTPLCPLCNSDFTQIINI